MELNDKDLKKIMVIALVLILAFLTYLIIKPVLLSIIGGLLLAFIFFPVYKWVEKFVKYRSLAAAIVSVLVVIIIIAPLWFLIPIMVEQIFALFQLSQGFEIQSFLINLIPSEADNVINQIASGSNSAISKLTSSILNGLVKFLLNFPIILLHLLLVAFVFFFALKDEARLKEFVSGLSPLKKSQEKILIKKFKDITNTLIYGQIVVGVIQGVLAGIGFFVFGVPNALILTVLAVILSVIPVIGPFLIYLPVSLYLGLSGSPLIAVGFLLYNVLIVSTTDNILRTLIVSRKAKLSQVVVLVGMIGGFFIFGILGIILGPLILAYFITLLEAYKQKTLSSLFTT